MSREGLIPQLQAHDIHVTEMKYGQHSVSVYQGTYQAYPAAIKVLALASGTDYTKLESESRTLISLSHEHILRLYNFFWENNGISTFLVMVTEWCEKDLAKDMKQKAEHNFPWREEDLWKLTSELVSALAYMQEQGLSHRDIKPENIFLTSTKSVKLGDFGSARTFQSDIDSATLAGTPFYLSPKLKEAFMRNDMNLVHNSFKSDVYSLGLTLIAIALLGPPMSLAKADISNEEVQAVISTVPYSDLFKYMLSQMLSVDEDTRCDFKILQDWIETNDPRYEKPKIPPPKKAKETLCMQCQHVIDPFSETAQCEVVQLYCEPSKHMFCSRECFKYFLSLGSSRCPQCGVVIPSETLDFYSHLESMEADRNRLAKVINSPTNEERKYFAMPSPILSVSRPKTAEVQCMQCNKVVDRYSPNAECEVVQLFCEPSKHMFCSRKCCKTYLCSGVFQCPQCRLDVPGETVVFYLTDDKQAGCLNLNESSYAPDGDCEEKQQLSEAGDSRTSEISSEGGLQDTTEGTRPKRRIGNVQPTSQFSTCECCGPSCSLW